MTDPHNLGAIARSAAAFGADGLVIPERRAAGVTPAAWKASAGTLARLPVARVTNLTRTLTEYAAAGLMLVGLDGRGDVDIDDLELATVPWWSSSVPRAVACPAWSARPATSRCGSRWRVTSSR